MDRVARSPQRPIRTFARLAACAALLSGVAAAQPRSGSEFRVNTETTYSHGIPGVSFDPNNGGFIVTWITTGGNCYYQRFNSAGAAVGAPAFVAGSASGGCPMTALAPGGVVAVAPQTKSGGGGFELWAYRPNGMGLTYANRVNTFTAGSTTGQRIASDANGNFVVVWTYHAGTSYGIYGKRFLYSGAPALLAPEAFISNDSSLNSDGRAPAIAQAPGGQFVVVWMTQVAGPTQIHGKAFNATGDPLGGVFLVSDVTVGSYSPDVAMDSSGNFVVVWHDYGYPSPTSYNVRARRYTSNGSPLGESFRVNAYTTGIADFPRVAKSNLGFIVVWEELQGDGSGYAVMGRRFAANGSPVASAFRVNTTTTGNQDAPSIAASPGGHFMAVWEGVQGARIDIFGQRFCIGGDVNGDGFVNVSDVLYLINNLFAGGPPPAGCADANASGAIDVSDVLYLINHLFAGGPAPV